MSVRKESHCFRLTVCRSGIGILQQPTTLFPWKMGGSSFQFFKRTAMGTKVQHVVQFGSGGHVIEAGGES